MTKKYAAVFDWNGTLLDDGFAVHAAANKLLQWFGKAPVPLETYQAAFEFPIVQLYENLGVPKQTYMDNLVQTEDIFYNTYLEELDKDVRLRAGSRELLQWLKDNDVFITIVSNQVTHNITKYLEELNITHFFDRVSGNDDVYQVIHTVNKGERARKILAEAGISGRKAFITGDTLEEIHIAQDQDLIGVSVLDGMVNEPRLREAGPDYVVNSFEELIKPLQSEWGLA